MKSKTQDFRYNFPAVRGIQAGHRFYLATVPFPLLIKLFRLEEADEDIPPELRAQRHINWSRVPKIARYINDNPETYVLPTITASIGGDCEFTSHNEKENLPLGTLSISMDSPLLINDGQHRRAAIEQALKENKALRYEHISVVFYIDKGLKHSQQIFSDINQNAMKPTSSINHLFNHRDPINQVVAAVLAGWPELNARIEKAKGSATGKSAKLFTLSAFRKANDILLNVSGVEWADEPDAFEAQVAALAKVALTFWRAAVKHVYGWAQALRDMQIAQELREQSITGHVVFLEALARVGNQVLLGQRHRKVVSFKRLEKLKALEHNRHAALWEGRCVVLGKMQKTQDGIALTANVLKQLLGYKLGPEEVIAEAAAKRHQAAREAEDQRREEANAAQQEKDIANAKQAARENGTSSSLFD